MEQSNHGFAVFCRLQSKHSWPKSTTLDLRLILICLLTGLLYKVNSDKIPRLDSKATTTLDNARSLQCQTRRSLLGLPTHERTHVVHESRRRFVAFTRVLTYHQPAHPTNPTNIDLPPRVHTLQNTSIRPGDDGRAGQGAHMERIATA